MANITFRMEINRTDRNGLVPLYVRITHNRRHKRIALGHKVEGKFWKKRKDGKGYYLSSSAPNYKAVMHAYNLKMAEAHTYAVQNDAAVTSAAVQKKLRGEGLGDFFAFAERLIGQLGNQEQIATMIRYRVAVKKLKVFVGRDRLAFREITVAFLNDFVHHLKMKGNKINTIYHGNIKTLKAIYNRAISEDVVSFANSPFLKFKMKHEKANREKLTEEEMERIGGLELAEGSRLWHGRNFFLFSFYCAGIRFRDFAQLKWKNMQRGRLIYRMGKTGVVKNIKLPKQAADILRLYGNESVSNEDFAFPLLKSSRDYSDSMYLFTQISSRNAMVNKTLKELAKAAGIDKRLSFHISRHTFTNIARRKTADLHSLKSLLGHSSIKVTEQYLAGFDEETQDKALEAIFS